MRKEIIINADKDQTRIAILEQGQLAELYIENPENERTLGNIFLGRIRRIMPSIKAAFVDIGQKQDAFLHFSDLAENLVPWFEYLDLDEPDVTKVKLDLDPHRPSGRRRHPRGNRQGGQRGGGRQGQARNDNNDNNGRDEDDAPDNGPNEAPKDRYDDENGGVKAAEAPARGGKHGVADARTRGKRRQAQRRNTQRQDKRSGDANPSDARPRRAESYLKRDQRILVKISKEPIASKGSRVTTDISLAGRFLVLVPLADYVAVSKKIVSYKERRRLRTLAKSLVPDGFGVIVRTVAEGRNAKALDTDLRLLVEKWQKIEKNLQGKPKAPLVVHEDVNMVSSVMRDLFSDDYDRILIDDPRVYRNIKNYVQAIAPDMVKDVIQHRGKEPVFETAKIAGAVAEAFESRVDLPSGGYLFIERTEAMHVVDVNSGRAGRGLSQEQNSLRVNVEAARVIAKQVRLRDLGGILVVDFIDMRDERNRRKVYDELKKEFRRDRAVSKILPMSDFGLVQITRQRLRPSITTTFAGPNGTTTSDDDDGSGGGSRNSADPHRSPAEVARKARDERDQVQRSKSGDRRERGDRGGRGERGERGERGKTGDSGTPSPPEDPVGSEALLPVTTALQALPAVGPDELVRAMERWVIAYKKAGQRAALTLKVHPFTAAYLNRKVPNYPTRWFMKHLIRIRLQLDRKVDPMSFRFFDAQTKKDVTEMAHQLAREATAD